MYDVFECTKMRVWKYMFLSLSLSIYIIYISFVHVYVLYLTQYVLEHITSIPEVHIRTFLYTFEIHFLERKIKMKFETPEKLRRPIGRIHKTFRILNK